MEKTWRWFGKNDKITLEMLRQIGVEGIVTALHDVPLGDVWTREQIRDLREYIEARGLRWSVVESLPVTETIKYGGADRDEQIEIYKQSLRNLAAEGIYTVCYNFMPVLDWARTDLLHPNADGSSNLYFSYSEFAYFDIYILKREGAREEWAAFRFPDGVGEGRNVLAEADALAAQRTPEGDHRLVENIVIKTQGFVSGNFHEGDEHPLELFHQLLAKYEGIDKAQLQANMRYFLEAIMPVCEECGINMCVHPDDPPIPILGLPRIVRTAEDIRWFLNAVPNFHNGLTFCAGSLSAGAGNDVVAMAREFAPRTHFVHLRSCHIFPNGDFTEASHLGGRADLIELCRIFLQEEARRQPSDVPRQASDVPGQPSDVPEQASDIPGQASDVPEQASDIPGQASDVPEQASDIPGQASDTPSPSSCAVAGGVSASTTPLPFRVDHGRTMLGDETRGYNAGYSFLGRMFAMAQMQGVLAALDHQ